MDQVIRIGMDTSKHIFQLHGVNAAEAPVLRKKLRRKEMMAFFAKLEPTEIAIEACGASHHWARLLQSFGHRVKLIPPQLVKPYVKRGKNDAADAEALCEAMSRPTMRFVPVKTAEQQAALMLVGVRERLIRNRTQLANAIRGYAAEFGVTAARGLAHLAPLLARLQADARRGGSRLVLHLRDGLLQPVPAALATDGVVMTDPDQPAQWIELRSEITCPHCGHRRIEEMPKDACQFFYECGGCHILLRPKLAIAVCSVPSDQYRAHPSSLNDSTATTARAAGSISDQPYIPIRALRLVMIHRVPPIMTNATTTAKASAIRRSREWGWKSRRRNQRRCTRT